MPTSTSARVESPAPLPTDEIVHTLAEFPELMKAVRDGDLATISILCAQLFDLDASRSTRFKSSDHSQAE